MRFGEQCRLHGPLWGHGAQRPSALLDKNRLNICNEYHVIFRRHATEQGRLLSLCQHITLKVGKSYSETIHSRKWLDYLGYRSKKAAQTTCSNNTQLEFYAVSLRLKFYDKNKSRTTQGTKGIPTEYPTTKHPIQNIQLQNRQRHKIQRRNIQLSKCNKISSFRNVKNCNTQNF